MHNIGKKRIRQARLDRGKNEPARPKKCSKSNTIPQYQKIQFRNTTISPPNTNVQPPNYRVVTPTPTQTRIRT